MQVPLELEYVNSRPKLDYSGALFWTSTNWTLTFKLVNFAIVGHYLLVIIMTALCNRAGHYIFAMWFLSSSIFFLSSPNLSGRRLDVYRTSTHGVALVQI